MMGLDNVIKYLLGAPRLDRSGSDIKNHPKQLKKNNKSKCINFLLGRELYLNSTPQEKNNNPVFLFISDK